MLDVLANVLRDRDVQRKTEHDALQHVNAYAGCCRRFTIADIEAMITMARTAAHREGVSDHREGLKDAFREVINRSGRVSRDPEAVQAISRAVEAAADNWGVLFDDVQHGNVMPEQS
ncbi:MAG: hypothetical protein REI11_18955 [Patulibacter sp.]|nr:hypothetical protein [Patulibacter sp.]